MGGDRAPVWGDEKLLGTDATVVTTMRGHLKPRNWQTPCHVHPTAVNKQTDSRDQNRERLRGQAEPRTNDPRAQAGADVCRGGSRGPGGACRGGIAAQVLGRASGHGARGTARHWGAGSSGAHAPERTARGHSGAHGATGCTPHPAPCLPGLPGQRFRPWTQICPRCCRTAACCGPCSPAHVRAAGLLGTEKLGSVTSFPVKHKYGHLYRRHKRRS